MTHEELADRCLATICASVGTLPNPWARNHILAAIREAVETERERAASALNQHAVKHLSCECPTCEGTGRQWAMNKDLSDPGYWGPPCPACEGKGVL